ncbi:MAG: hypothetical protein P8I45_06630 [Nitrospinaceae bacterium]|nr:hypothetical protein [Nitrospinaceae bacterium]
MFTFKKGLTVLFITLMGVCSVFAQEKDWVFWQGQFFQANADNASDYETAYFWRTQEPHIKEMRITAILPDYPWVKISSYKNRTVERCITCHDGISTVSSSHPPEFGCAICHGGEPESVDKNQAHATLIYDPQAGTGKRNPSSLSVVEKSCGQLYCHSGHIREDRNHIQRLNKSMMNTLAGMISGLRYQWAGQSKKTARYAKRAISDKDGNIPHEWGALEKLDKLPYFSSLDIPESDKNTIQPISKHPSDRLLRQKCFQCHIDSPPPPGQYRSQGCAACHFAYSKTGFYEGNDPTISKTQPGHAKLHQIQALPKRKICVQCHQRFSIETLGNEPSPVKNIILGPINQNEEAKNMPEETLQQQAEVQQQQVSEGFSAMMNNEELLTVESQKEDSKSAEEEELSLFTRKGNVQIDVHTARGLDCIDCHTQRDIMGDGNLYSKQHQAVEIRCETCHGNDSTYPMISKVTELDDAVIRLSKHYKGKPNSVGDWMAVSKRKKRMTNVKVQNGKMVTIGKRSGRVYNIPLLRNKQIHFIPQHQSRLECTACHSQWVAGCQSCHASMKLGQVELKTSERTPIKIQQPYLMIGPRGKVAPMFTQPERHFSMLDEKGNPILALGPTGQHRGKYQKWHFTNPDTSSGSNLAYSLNPHSTGTKVRSCESCHLSPETLGLGKGDLKIGANNTGKNDALVPLNRLDEKTQASVFDPQAKVSIRGEVLAGSHQLKARPFNQKEIIRILRVGNCIPCHDRYGDRIYQDIKKSYAFASTLEHRQLREQILNSRQIQP